MNLRKLIRGKALGAQPFFFDTFNAIVDFVRNLKGDKDVNSSTGSVELDRTDPAHPVIRFNGKASGGDGGGGGGGESVTNGSFTIIAGTGDTIHFSNRYYNFGNLTLQASDITLSAGGVVVALKVTTLADQSSPTATIVTYDSLAALQADQHARNYVVIPLYQLAADFSIICDFRVAPVALVGEVL